MSKHHEGSYMGKSAVLDEAIAEFAIEHSTQTNRDHERLAE